MSDAEDQGSDYEREQSPEPEPVHQRTPSPSPEPEEAPKFKPKPPVQHPVETAGKTEAEVMMDEKRKRDKDRMEAEIQEYHEQREEEIARMNEDISELTEKIEKRRLERIEEDRRLAEAGAIEQQRRKAEEDERQRKKNEERDKKKEERDRKAVEAEERASQMGKRSFVITRKNKAGEEIKVEEDKKEESVKSKEQLEAEKKAILEQRIAPLGNVGNMDEATLKEKAKELHTHLFRLESDKYDLEQHLKQRQYEMMELAERARNMNKGKKKINVSQESDPIAEKFSGVPPKIQLCSKYERHKDRRTYCERKTVFFGPIYAEDTPRILPAWEQEGGEGTRPPPPKEEDDE